MTQCGSNSSADVRRVMTVDLLYIDLAVCDRCQGADNALQEALAEVAPVLTTLGVDVRFNSHLIEGREQAEALRFVSSPTVRIDGRDIQPAAKESSCAACSTLVDAGSVDCREWLWHGQSYTAPPKGMLVEVLLRAALGEKPDDQPDSGQFRLPANLVSFFEKRQAPVKSACGCGC